MDVVNGSMEDLCCKYVVFIYANPTAGKEGFMKARLWYLKSFEFLLSQDQGGASLHRRHLDLLLGLYIAELAADSPGPRTPLPGLLPPALCLRGMPQPCAGAQVLPGLPLACEDPYQPHQEAARALLFSLGGRAPHIFLSPGPIKFLSTEIKKKEKTEEKSSEIHFK